MAKITTERVGEYLKTVLLVLQDNDGQLPVREMFRQVEDRLQLTEHECARYEKSGYVRWESVIHFYSINASKAGWLVKKKGVWYLTPEGASALRLTPKEIFEASHQAYAEWKQKQVLVPKDEDSAADDGGEVGRETAYEQAVGLAREEIHRFINELGPYEFQDLVAALLRAMGYHTPFVAPRGKDGGVDILAYRDPLGTVAPRIKVQVKHRPSQKVTVQEARELSGLLHKEGDVGLLVSTGGFSSEAVAEARRAPRHIEKMDLDEFISFWQDHYENLAEDDKALLPLRAVLFIPPAEG